MPLTHVARPLILVLRALPVVVKKGGKGRDSILESPPFASVAFYVASCQPYLHFIFLLFHFFPNFSNITLCQFLWKQ